MPPKDSTNHQKAEEKLALELISQGKLKEAEDIYTNLVNSGSINDVIYGNLGAILKKKGDIFSATLFLKKSLDLNPSNPNVHNNLGIAFEDQGEITAAIASLNRAIELKLNFPEAHYNLGNALKKNGDLTAAIASYKLALQFKPDYPEAHYNLGNAYFDKGDITAAITEYNVAVQLRPNYLEAHNNLGNALKETGDLTAAIAYFNKLLELTPDNPQAHYNLGNAYLDKGDLTAAITAYNKSLELQPENPKSHLNLSLALLLSGDHENGWNEYEWRTKQKDNPSRLDATPNCSLWQGRSLNQKTKLLLVTEQGLGDTLQFMRYALTLKGQGIDISLCALSRLHPLIRASGIDSSPLSPEQANQVTEGSWIPLLSVPLHLKVSPSNPIITKPYIKSTNELTDKWKSTLSAGIKPTIGINWRGNRMDISRRSRNIPTFIFKKLIGSCAVNFLYLQRGARQLEIEQLTLSSKLPAQQSEILRIADSDTPEDFLEYAAIIANCDLVITTGSTVAHLAAAIGIPTWVLLPKIPDWRWGLGGDTTFWYPSMRLFRQRETGNWDEVMERVTEALQEQFGERPSPRKSA